MKVEVNASQVVLQDVSVCVCVCLCVQMCTCVCVCVCVCVWWRLSALLSYKAWRAQVIALHVKRAEMCVCACLQVREWGRDCPFSFLCLWNRNTVRVYYLCVCAERCIRIHWYGHTHSSWDKNTCSCGDHTALRLKAALN